MKAGPDRLTKPCPKGHIDFKITKYNKRRCLECERINIKKLRLRNRVWLNQQKDKPCTDCGQTFPPYCMDFDHVEDNKSIDVSKMLRSVIAIEKIQKEIDKCELVCSNCHRIRTYSRTMKVWGREEELEWA